jgi:hypothetical protein
MHAEGNRAVPDVCNKSWKDTSSLRFYLLSLRKEYRGVHDIHMRSLMHAKPGKDTLRVFDLWNVVYHHFYSIVFLFGLKNKMS